MLTTRFFNNSGIYRSGVYVGLARFGYEYFEKLSTVAVTKGIFADQISANGPTEEDADLGVITLGVNGVRTNVY